MRHHASEYDLVVVGGGVNGLAIARDASVRGLSVLLVERDDFGAETSSWSSRMIHGGLRYLEQLDLSLVRESLVERETLFRNAPHLVKPMRLLIPIYAESTRGRSTIRAGMLAYDLLSAGKSVARHRLLSPAAVAAQVPALRRSGLRGAAEYTDGQVELSERLCVELAVDAGRHGAVLLTKTEVVGLSRAPQQRVEVRIVGSDGARTVTGSVVVDAAGPWAGDVTSAAGLSGRLVGGTRGSHIALPRFPGAPDRAIHFETAAGKPLLVIPWRDVLLVGSTDVLDDDGDRRPRISPQERELLLAQVNRMFRDAGLTDADILFSYSGIRPLPHAPGRPATAITRRHAIRAHEHFGGRVLSIIGGKLTTHRSLAEETVDAVLKTMGRRPVRCTTAQLALPGYLAAVDRPAVLGRLRGVGVEAAVAARAVDKYGARAAALADLVDADPPLGKELAGLGSLAAEVVLAVEKEYARSLTDVIYRRLACRFDLVTTGLVDQVADVLRAHAGWPAERLEADRTDLAAHATRLAP